MQSGGQNSQLIFTRPMNSPDCTESFNLFARENALMSTGPGRRWVCTALDSLTHWYEQPKHGSFGLADCRALLQANSSKGVGAYMGNLEIEVSAAECQ